MEKKGQLAVGGLVLMVVAVIVVVAILPEIARNQDTMTETTPVFVKDLNITVLGTQALRGQELISLTNITNTTGTGDCANNFTIDEQYWEATNTKRIIITQVGTPTTEGVDCQVVDIAYVAGLEGYIDNAGGRSVAGLIVLFCCLGLLAAAIYYYIRNNGWLLNFQ